MKKTKKLSGLKKQTEASNGSFYKEISYDEFVEIMKKEYEKLIRTRK